MVVDSPQGAKLLLQKLAMSPLVRRNLPNAAAICSQYFSFRRSPQESIGNFLVRETLIHEEFVEALIRLWEDKQGVAQEQREFGLPEDDDGWVDDDWGKGYIGRGTYLLDTTDGWRLLQAAGLSPDEMRDILPSTKNSMDYELIAAALQNLWDDQLLGNRPKLKPFYDDASWWDDGYAYYTDHGYEDEWWQDDWGSSDIPPQVNAATAEPVDEDKMREAQQAEQMAESLAIEAQRTWSEAQRASQALRRDRGLGHLGPGPRNTGSPSKGKSKGKAKYGYASDMDVYYIKGKTKSKGKGKGPEWAPRTVNAFATDYFTGGLELSSTVEVPKPPQTRALPELGMIDFRATASAAPEAVVKGLISAILEKDSGARVDIDTNARPYFRVGDGRWGRIDPETAEILAAAAKAKAAPKKQRARSLDINRSMKMDPWDPRSSPKCWPCYGRHLADKPQANQWGQWVHCQVCNLRILYTPRKGALANNTLTYNAAMVKKMLSQLKPLLGDRKPTAKEIIGAAPPVATSKQSSSHGYPSGTITDYEEADDTTCGAKGDGNGVPYGGGYGVYAGWVATGSRKLRGTMDYNHELSTYRATTTYRRKMHGTNLDSYGINDGLGNCGCPWSTIDKELRQQRNQDTQRRKDRKVLGYAVDFVKYVLSMDDETQVYWEMPTNNHGWKQAPLLHLREWLELKLVPWLGCRLDGCVYGLREESQGDLVLKKWTIQTTDERFHKVYRAKVCVGNHHHSATCGVDYQRGSSYPGRMVESIVRTWRDELAPPRHHRLLSLQQDQPALCDEWPEAEPVEVVDDMVTRTDDNLVDHDSLLIESFRIQHEHQAREARVYESFDWETCSSLLQQLYDYGQAQAELIAGELHLESTALGWELTKYLNSFLRHHLPEQSWSSIMVTFNTAALPHQDHHNLKGTVNILTCMGNFDQGGLWLQGQPPRGYAAVKRLVQGLGYVNGYVEPTKNKFVIFNPRQRHASQRWSGFRISLAVYTTRLAPWMDDQKKKTMKELGSRVNQNLIYLYKAWQAVTVDAAEWPVPGTRQKVKFLLFMDYATKLRAVVPLKTVEVMAMQAENAEDVIQAFSERWLSVFPKPQVVIMGAAKTFTSARTHEFLSSINILPHLIAEKEHWSHGVAEAAVQDVKATATSIHLEAREQRPFVTFLGVPMGVRTDYRTFANEADHQHRDFSQLVVVRQQVEEIARKTKAQRVLSKLANTTVRQPLREFKEMDLVKIWRRVWPQEVHKGPRGGMKMAGRPHWIGPGRVVFHEVLPQQQPGDQRRHIVWVLLGARLYRCSVHSVLPTTETERFIYETSSVEDLSRWKTLADIPPRREYQDVVDEEPHEEERELPDLPQQPDDTTVQVPQRRIRQKTSFRAGDYTDRPVRDRLQTEEVNDYGPDPQVWSRVR
ncbi:unnamed protein product, partial [Symbiodinium sp. CCMP2456]